MANKANLSSLYSWVLWVRKEGTGKSVSNFFLDLSALRTYFSPVLFVDFRTTFDYSTPLVSVQNQLLAVGRIDFNRLGGPPGSLSSAFSASFGSGHLMEIFQTALFLVDGFLSMWVTCPILRCWSVSGWCGHRASLHGEDFYVRNNFWQFGVRYLSEPAGFSMTQCFTCHRWDTRVFEPQRRDVRTDNR